jgi:ERCC4-related helicase
MDAVHSGGLLEEEVKWEKLDEEESNSEKLKLIKPIILLEPLEKTHTDQNLIFVRMTLDVDLLENYLSPKAKESSKELANCYSCEVLARKRSMEERQNNLKSFKDGELRILVATDVAARGIDVFLWKGRFGFSNDTSKCHSKAGADKTHMLFFPMGFAWFKS